MREIKFRGKCSQSKRWVYGWLLTNKLGTYIVTEENPHECTQNHYIEIDEYCRVVPDTVGQFTGLHDKNGKEIYEGDICRVSSDTFYSNSYATLEESWELMMQVVFCNYAFIFRCLQDKHLEILLAETLWEDFEIEIVGNIYENPDLLEPTK